MLDLWAMNFGCRFRKSSRPIGLARTQSHPGAAKPCSLEIENGNGLFGAAFIEPTSLPPLRFVRQGVQSDPDLATLGRGRRGRGLDVARPRMGRVQISVAILGHPDFVTLRSPGFDSDPSARLSLILQMRPTRSKCGPRALSLERLLREHQEVYAGHGCRPGGLPVEERVSKPQWVVGKP